MEARAVLSMTLSYRVAAVRDIRSLPFSTCLLRSLGPITAGDVDTLGNRVLLAGGPRDILAARDSVKEILGLSCPSPESPGDQFRFAHNPEDAIRGHGKITQSGSNEERGPARRVEGIVARRISQVDLGLRQR